MAEGEQQVEQQDLDQYSLGDMLVRWGQGRGSGFIEKWFSGSDDPFQFLVKSDLSLKELKRKERIFNHQHYIRFGELNVEANQVFDLNGRRAVQRRASDDFVKVAAGGIGRMGRLQELYNQAQGGGPNRQNGTG